MAVWIRNFQYYIDGQVDLQLNQKLLYQVGTEVQKLYENLGIQVVDKLDVALYCQAEKLKL